MGNNTKVAPLIGRDDQVRVVLGELDRTLTSHGGLVLVTGEAGIGKTAFAGTIAAGAQSRGALVLSAAAWGEDGTPGYWLWTQIVRDLQCVSEWPDDQTGDPLRVLLGEVVVPPGQGAETEDTVFGLHDAVTTLLVAVSRRRPVVILLDDLHWADLASVRLLGFLVRHSWFERLLVIATYRDVEINSAGHPLNPLLMPLISRAVTVPLVGLDAGAVCRLIAQVLGRAPDSDVVADVLRLTGGNPFFVEQTVHMRASGQPDPVAPGVGEALMARLSPLHGDVVSVLTTAAVIGREFSLDLLACVSGTDADSLPALLGQATTARLITHKHGRFVFVHDLLREVLRTALDSAELRKRHAMMVAVLEERPGIAGRPAAWTLAHHAYHAVPAIEPSRALRYVLDAAADACGRLAAGEVALHYRRALELLPDTDVRRRAALMLDLAGAHHGAGELAEARAVFENTVALADELGDRELRARAVLGLHELGSGGVNAAGRREIALLDNTHAALLAQGKPAHDPLMVRLLAAASRARTHSASDNETIAAAKELSDRALTLARRSGDDAALGLSLVARHDAVWSPGTGAERATLSSEMVAVAHRDEDTGLELQGSLLRMAALLEHGDPRGLTAYASATAMAARSASPRGRFLARSRDGAIATLTGRFDEARDAIYEAYALGERLGEGDSVALWREQRWVLALLEGDFAEGARLEAEYRHDSTLHGNMVRLVNSAQRGGGEVSATDIAGVIALSQTYPRMYSAIFLRAQAQVAAASGDEKLCARARAALWPYRDLWAVVAGAGGIHGPYSHWIALLDLATLRLDDAIAGFSAAHRSADLLGARPWSVEARFQLARALHARDESGDADAATALLAGVRKDADEVGMRHISSAVAEIFPAQLDSGKNGSGQFWSDGSVWTLGYAGRVAHLPDAKGLRDLHLLLGSPGREVSAAELINPASLVRAAEQSGADLVLDERAREEYRTRLAQLDEQIERAVHGRRDQRAAELDRERAALIEELRTATGRGGRARKLGETGERARKTVTARIRDTLRRIESNHPELGEHLRASVRTGLTCHYQPVRPVRWQLSAPVASHREA